MKGGTISNVKRKGKQLLEDKQDYMRIMQEKKYLPPTKMAKRRGIVHWIQKNHINWSREDVYR
jgi:hypothetical protein